MEREQQRDEVRTEHEREGESPPPVMERRPLGALAVTGFLTVTILVFWFGMFALNLARS